MKKILFFVLVFLALTGSILVQDQISSFQHIVLIVQENRTPDNLFQGLCLPPFGSSAACGTGAGQYDIQNFGLDKNGNHIALSPVPLGNSYDPDHSHRAFEVMCNPNKTTFFPCSQNTKLQTTGCPLNCSFEYVDPNSTPTIYPYLYMRGTSAGPTVCSRLTRDPAHRRTSSSLVGHRRRARMTTL